MANVKLTKKRLDELQPRDKEFVVWDDQVAGLGVKVTPTGRKVFLFQYRLGGKEGRVRKFTIGTFGDFTVEQARTNALKLRADVALQKDPALEKQKVKCGYTTDAVEDVLERYLAHHGRYNRSTKEVRRIFEKNVLPYWRGRTIHTIFKSDIRSCIERQVLAGHGYAANRTTANIRAFFRWCVNTDILERSPAEAIVLPEREPHVIVICHQKSLVRS